jgi:transposase
MRPIRVAIEKGPLFMRDTDLYAALLGIKYPWTVAEVKLDVKAERVDVLLKDVSGAKHLCPICEKPSSTYDHAELQVWRHLDTCQCDTYLHARLPRTKCSEHGVHEIKAPWAGPRSSLTLRYECEVIDVIKECDITGVTRLTGLTWDVVFTVMSKAVERGLERKPRKIPEYIGVDEKSFTKRHNYETIVCDLEKGTVEYVADDRTKESLIKYYQQFSKEELSEVKAVTMDMWDPYILATKKCIPEADSKIVFDRYHATRYVNEAVDKVRRSEHKQLSREGDERLKGTRHLWLYNEDNIPEWKLQEFSELKAAELKTSRAWAIKESLRHFWDYTYQKNAETYFDRWYFWATHSRLKPIIEAAKTLKSHLTNIMTYFKHKITNALSEGVNSKIQTIKNMACGFRNREHYKQAIYFHCGGLDLYPRLT